MTKWEGFRPPTKRGYREKFSDQVAEMQMEAFRSGLAEGLSLAKEVNNRWILHAIDPVKNEQPCDWFFKEVDYIFRQMDEVGEP